MFSVFSTDLPASNNTLFLRIRNGNTSSAGIFHLIAPAFLPGASVHHHCNAVFLSTAVWHFAARTTSGIHSILIFEKHISIGTQRAPSAVITGGKWQRYLNIITGHQGCDIVSEYWSVTQTLFLTPHSSPLQPFHIHTQTPKPLPCSPIVSQAHILRLIVIVFLCELFPLHNICKLYTRSWYRDEQKCRLQLISAVNKEAALKCAEWPVRKQKHLQTVYCWDAMMWSEMQQPEDWSKMGSQRLGQAQPEMFSFSHYYYFKARALL